MGPIEEGPAALSPIAVSDFDGFVIRRHEALRQSARIEIETRITHESETRKRRTCHLSSRNTVGDSTSIISGDSNPSALFGIVIVIHKCAKLRKWR